MGKKGRKPAATKGGTGELPTLFDAVSDEGRVLTMLEVDPATEDPALLDAIRYVRRRDGLSRPSRNPQAQACACLYFYYVDGDGDGGGLSSLLCALLR